MIWKLCEERSVVNNLKGFKNLSHSQWENIHVIQTIGEKECNIESNEKQMSIISNKCSNSVHFCFNLLIYKIKT